MHEAVLWEFEGSVSLGGGEGFVLIHNVSQENAYLTLEWGAVH